MFADGEQQFDVLKNDAYDGIEPTYYDDSYACLLYTSTADQKSISPYEGLSVPKLSHHQSGNPCSLAHSVGVNLRTVYSLSLIHI